ncbi:hypothetical protein EDM80_02640 [bacterium]|nr:MAG: hypothetical protein EDM80_02640 [bacterium]
MSHAAAAHSDTEVHSHEEHLEIWPDAGITETAKPVAWWLLLLYIGFTAGLCMAYWNQFVEHEVGYPKFGAGWLHKSEEQQFPGKIDPVIRTQAEATWQVGQEAELVLRAEGGRGGQVWLLGDDDVLPPGTAFVESEAGVAIAGTPTKPGEYRFTIFCHSGQGKGQKTITIEVKAAGQ